MFLLCICFFFFSSRRRHTRFDCDWSSDVCSSDLGEPEHGVQPRHVVELGAGGEQAQVEAAPSPLGVRLEDLRADVDRSEERRVGKECRSRWWREQEEKKNEKKLQVCKCQEGHVRK